jgi:predicted  nucleic acid-binding Zn-ribbon protein
LNSQLPLLIELQKYDLRLFEILGKKKKALAMIKTAQGPVLEMSTQLKTVQEAGAVLDKQRRDGEQELSIQEEHLQNSRSRLNKLKMNMEYQTHLVEIELARKKKVALEDAVLKILEQVERNEQEAKDLQIKTGKAEQAFAHAKEQGKSEIAALEQELSVLEEQHGALTKRMGPALLASYTKLKSLRKGLVIAKMQDGTCLGCRLRLPPQLEAEVKRADELLQCVYCHRILYWEPAT